MSPGTHHAHCKDPIQVPRNGLLCRSAPANEFQWRLSNGLWALFIGFGTVLCALKVQTARSWRFFHRPVRSFLADYGVTVSVVFWSCLSYALRGAPEGVPRRLALPNTWDVRSTWTVANVSYPALLSRVYGNRAVDTHWHNIKTCWRRPDT